MLKSNNSTHDNQSDNDSQMKQQLRNPYLLEMVNSQDDKYKNLLFLCGNDQVMNYSKILVECLSIDIPNDLIFILLEYMGYCVFGKPLSDESIFFLGEMPNILNLLTNSSPIPDAIDDNDNLDGNNQSFASGLKAIVATLIGCINNCGVDQSAIPGIVNINININTNTLNNGDGTFVAIAQAHSDIKADDEKLDDWYYGINHLLTGKYGSQFNQFMKMYNFDSREWIQRVINYFNQNDANYGTRRKELMFKKNQLIWYLIIAYYCYCCKYSKHNTDCRKNCEYAALHRLLNTDAKPRLRWLDDLVHNNHDNSHNNNNKCCLECSFKTKNDEGKCKCKDVENRNKNGVNEEAPREMRQSEIFWNEQTAGGGGIDQLCWLLTTWNGCLFVHNSPYFVFDSNGRPHYKNMHKVSNAIQFTLQLDCFKFESSCHRDDHVCDCDCCHHHHNHQVQTVFTVNNFLAIGQHIECQRLMKRF